MSADLAIARAGGPIYAGKKNRPVHCGDVPGNMHDFIEHRQRAETAVRKILAAGALRIISGGDHAILIPVLHATKVAGRLRSYIDVPRAKYKSMEGERTAA